jgi:hypothetical protein
MKATIKFNLSKEGQRAALLAGRPAEANQEMEVGKDDPEFARLVQLGEIDGRGDVLLIDHWEVRWDTYPTPKEILDGVVFRAGQARQEAEQKRLATRDETLTVLLERKTVVSQTVYRSHGEYRLYAEAWPYLAPDDVVSSPEAQAWSAELKAANDAVLLEIDRKDKEVAAENLRKEEEARQAELLRRQALGLNDGDEAYSVSDHALMGVPVWESHKRGKNWMAEISVNHTKPGGLERVFFEKAKGEACYVLAEDLAPGVALEFGADYYSGGGRRSSKRWYGYVVRIEPDALVLHKCESGPGACKEGAAFAKEHGAKPIDQDVQAGIDRVNTEGSIEPSAK